MDTDNGFTLVEMLASLVLTLVVVSAAVALLNPNQLVVQVQAEGIDMQQRVRVGVDVLARDLAMAGAGLYAGARGDRAGGLIQRFPPVLPRRTGLVGADSSTMARADAISIVYVPTTLSQTVTDATGPAGGDLTVAASPNCPLGESACGFERDMTIAVFDDSGQHDTFTVRDVQDGTAHVQPHGTSSSVYARGAHVAEVVTRTFYFDPAASQLRQYDGFQYDAPVLDNVVSLDFEYFDDAAQPLPLSSLSDGPWRGAGDGMFDADLCRVRTIRVSLRVQAALGALRSVGPAFLKPGSSRNSARSLPDVIATFSVSPRNMGVRP